MFLFNIWLVAEGNIFLRPGRGGACSSRSNDLPQTRRAGACLPPRRQIKARVPLRVILSGSSEIRQQRISGTFQGNLPIWQDTRNVRSRTRPKGGREAESRRKSGERIPQTRSLNSFCRPVGRGLVSRRGKRHRLNDTSSVSALNTIAEPPSPTGEGLNPSVAVMNGTDRTSPGGYALIKICVHYLSCGIGGVVSRRAVLYHDGNGYFGRACRCEGGKPGVIACA